MEPQDGENGDPPEPLDVRQEAGRLPGCVAGRDELDLGERVERKSGETRRSIDTYAPTDSTGLLPRRVRRVIIYPMISPPAYQLVDFGGGARLERFGDRVVDRPHAAALGSRSAIDSWGAADLRFDRERGWTGPAMDAGNWTFVQDGLTLELRATDAGQVGLFPEHLGMLPWLRARVADRTAPGRQVQVLHLFAYTGLARLAVADAGAEVTHVDASRPTVAWARRNAERSGMADRPIRWIVEDAVIFTQREARRGRRYSGVILDPPSYGHGPGARPWRLEEDLPRLLAACSDVLEPGGFGLLTAHTPGFDAARLGELAGRSFGWHRDAIDAGDLAVRAGDGRLLELGAFARGAGGA